MSDARPLIVTTYVPPTDVATWLAPRVRHVSIDLRGDDRARIDDVLREADALVVRADLPVDETLLARAARVRVIARAGVGLDNVDVRRCRARGIEVVYAPDANTQAVVEYVLALMCDALRSRPPLTEAVERPRWDALRAEAVARRELGACTIGILGLGRIGRRVARVAAALGATVIYRDLLEIPRDAREGAEPVSVEALFARSDVLTVHVDGRPSNRGYVNDPLLRTMRPDVVLINTSRGFVVDKVALAAFLSAHPEAQAHLDVHDPEPVLPGDPLLPLPNAHLYPHLASRTATAVTAMSRVVEDVVRVLAGEPPLNRAPEGTE